MRDTDMVAGKGYARQYNLFVLGIRGRVGTQNGSFSVVDQQGTDRFREYYSILSCACLANGTQCKWDIIGRSQM